jgi:hypothetical protein
MYGPQRPTILVSMQVYPEQQCSSCVHCTCEAKRLSYLHVRSHQDSGEDVPRKLNPFTGPAASSAEVNPFTGPAASSAELNPFTGPAASSAGVESLHRPCRELG